MKYTFGIMDKLPGLNEVISANRANKYMGAQLKKQTETIIGWHIVRAKSIGMLLPTEKPCTVEFEWHEATMRRDCDNIASAKKFILDALQTHGIIKNDNQRYITGFKDTFVKDSKDYVLVTLIEQEEE